MPFMARFHAIYLTSYLVGEGLSGFLPSLVALAQGVGGNPECRNVTFIINETESWRWEPYYPEPRFSVSTFFILLMILMLSSALAFVGLNRCSAARHEQVALKPGSDFGGTELMGTYNQTFVSSVETVAMSFKPSPSENIPSNCPTSSESRLADEKITDNELTLRTYTFLLFIQAWACALSNGGLPSIQSYSCLPYGNIAYHFAVTLSAMANPLCCLIAYFLPIKNVCLIVLFTLLGTGVSGYVIILAAMSPAPLLVGNPIGEALMVSKIFVRKTMHDY